MDDISKEIEEYKGRASSSGRVFIKEIEESDKK